MNLPDPPAASPPSRQNDTPSAAMPPPPLREPVTPAESLGGLPRRWILGGLVVLVVAGLGVAWWAWQAADTTAAGGQVPLIQAPTEPVRVRPDDPGGLDIADRDKLVYRRLSEGEPPPAVERLLPPPEEPQPPPRPKPATPAAVAPEPPAEPGEAPAAAAPGVSEPGLEQPPEVAAEPQPVAAASKAAEAPPPVTGGYQIQLASVHTEPQAMSEWKRIRARNKDLLGTLEAHVSRVDLAARGVWYRLRAGPVGGAEDARALCATLKQRKVGCLVVKPDG